MDHQGKLGWNKHNIKKDLHENDPQKYEGHGSTYYMVTGLLAAYFFVSFPPDVALNWVFAVGTSAVTGVEIAPKLHRHPLMHLLIAIIVGFIVLIVVAIFRHHSFSSLCFT